MNEFEEFYKYRAFRNINLDIPGKDMSDDELLQTSSIVHPVGIQLYTLIFVYKVFKNNSSLEYIQVLGCPKCKGAPVLHFADNMYWIDCLKCRFQGGVSLRDFTEANKFWRAVVQQIHAQMEEG